MSGHGNDREGIDRGSPMVVAKYPSDGRNQDRLAIGPAAEKERHYVLGRQPRQGVAKKFLKIADELVILFKNRVQEIEEHRAFTARPNGGYLRDVVQPPVLTPVAPF